MSIKLSRHFKERWDERVGESIPSPEEIEKMIRNRGIRWLQRCRDLYTTRGNRYRVLALYWIKERGIVIKVDEIKNVAITVIT